MITAVITPFDARNRIDEEAAVGLMRHCVEHGSDGLVVGGVTGEGALLSDAERLAIIQLGLHEVGDRANIVAGVAAPSTDGAVRLTERASELGADAVLATLPYGSPGLRRKHVLRHFEEIARASGCSVIVHNAPDRTDRGLSNDLLAELADLDGIEGVEQGRTTNLRLIEGLHLYAGVDEMFAPVLDMGGAGGILVASHLFGDAFKAMVDEPARRTQIDASLRDVYETLAICPNPAPIKAALNLTGFRAGGVRLPLVEADEADVDAIKAMLVRHGLLEDPAD